MYLNKIYPTIYAGQNIPDKIHRSKYTIENIPGIFYVKIYPDKIHLDTIPERIYLVKTCRMKLVCNKYK